MSLESAKKFIQKVKTDEAFAKKLREVTTPEQRQKMVTDAGFTFTQKELDEARKGELADEELVGVAGGGFICIYDSCQTHR
jgi:predicted ribosomally synthesized peptide with nif11-like leader